MTLHTVLKSTGKVFALAMVLGATFLAAERAEAQTYSSDLSQKFTQWCTTSQNQPATVCSCAVSKAAIEIPATAMASFLAAPAGSGTAMVGGSVGATALQIVTTCATTASGQAGSALSSGLNALGGIK